VSRVLRHGVIAFSIGVLALACAPGSGAPSGSLGRPVTERLEMEPFPGWREIADGQTRAGSRTEWVPAEQKSGEPSDRLTREVLVGKQSVAPQAFALERLTALTSDCLSRSNDGPRRATEEGNDVAYVELTCVRAGIRSLAALFKVIRGHEALYVAQREFHYLPSRADLRDARAYLSDQVYLCPIARGSGRCAKHQ